MTHFMWQVCCYKDKINDLFKWHKLSHMTHHKNSSKSWRLTLVSLRVIRLIFNESWWLKWSFKCFVIRTNQWLINLSQGDSLLFVGGDGSVFCDWANIFRCSHGKHPKTVKNGSIFWGKSLKKGNLILYSCVLFLKNPINLVPPSLNLSEISFEGSTIIFFLFCFCFFVFWSNCGLCFKCFLPKQTEQNTKYCYVP